MFDVEAVVGCIMCGIGILVELVLAPAIRGHGVMGMNNMQHGTMYFFFGLVCVISLVSARFRILPNSEDILYISLALAYITEATLFKFHLFGRQDVDILLHTLLLYTMYGAIVSTLLEMVYRHNMLLAQSRAFFTILQGTWFWQAGFYLYNPFRGDAWGGPFDSHDATEAMPMPKHKLMMFITCSFAWHMGAIFILVLVIGAVIGWRYKRRGDIDPTCLSPNRYLSRAGYSQLGHNDEEDEDEQIWGEDQVTVETPMIPPPGGSLPNHPNNQNHVKPVTMDTDIDAVNRT